MKLFSNRILFIEYLFIAIFLLQSCSSSDNSSEEAISLDATIDTTRFTSNATSGIVVITTNSNWTIEEVNGADWVSLSKAEGIGNDTITIQLSKNTVDEERFAKLVITSGDKTKPLYFSQAPATDGGSTTNASYFEIPKDTSIANCIKVTRFLPGSRSNMRNYTMLYDTNMKLAYWVAYPLTSTYIGSSGRSEAWEYDPLISEIYQPKLYSAFSGGYSRGHQIPSADRTYSTLENSTTFFFSNMTAQNYDLNSGIWVDLENKVRTWMKSADTMYVVTGAMIKTKTDATITYAYDNDNAKIAVPKYYFKALAQKRGTSYYTIAFKIDNAEPTSTDTYSSHAISVTELENETGFTFFPSLSTATKNQINTAIWSY